MGLHIKIRGMKNVADYERIEKAIDYLSENYSGQPSLESLAQHLRLSPFHVQRLFRRWAGVTPKQFISFLTLQQVKALLTQSKNVLDTSLDSGLSGPGRLHDLFVTLDAVTPGEFKAMGKGLKVTYGVHPTLFGTCLIATTPRGICNLSFVRDTAEARQELSQEWPKAELVHDPRATQVLIRQIFDSTSKQPLQLFLKGTNFQIKVWEALLKIPMGAVISYEDLAIAIKCPTSARAVSRAVATNPISYLIPCHRVIHKSGAMDGYRWNSKRKKAILVWESNRKGTHEISCQVQ